MCGILGVVSGGDPRLDLFYQGLDALAHRGPESTVAKRLTAPGAVCLLGHTRLRIRDVHERADQPMSEESGTAWITYNGELYNHVELRRELEGRGHRFATVSDTEVIVHLYEELGSDVERMLGRLRGMFAFALFDTSRERLLVCRDRLGIKPMYWCDARNGLAFASEARALVRAGLASGAPDQEGLGAYLMWGSVRGPSTLFEGVRELMPGSFIEWTPEGRRIARWWTLRLDPGSSNGADAVQALRATLDDAVARHLVADRPVGIFLSGGVDSSAIARSAAAHGASRGLTVTFPETEVDEGTAAARLADGLGIEHQRVEILGTDVATELGTIFRAMDQPTSDGVNTWVVSRAAREAGLVVALSGVGGDELFGGYPSFRLVPRLASIARVTSSIPASVRGFVSDPLTLRRPGSPVSRALSVAKGYGAAYAAVRGLLSERELRQQGVGLPLPGFPAVDGDGDPADRVTLLEMQNYLPNQLLRDADQMSMAHSLEVRVPLLDDEVVRLVLGLPSEIRTAGAKQLLARASGVEALSKRPFALPFQQWLRGPLNGSVREALLSERLPLGDVIPPNFRRRLWSAFEGRRIHWSRIWSIAVLRLWPEANGLNW